MYRIRRENGEEVSLGSIDEFGAAVAAGIVTAKAEIFHARAEKWLPIASHPHFKMAHDRISASAAPKTSARSEGIAASGQRPALGAPGQRLAADAAPSSAPSSSVSTAPRSPAPQLRVMRPEVAAPSASVDGTVTEKSAPRWTSAQRPAARAVAPKPSAPPAATASDLRLLRADTLLSSAATAPALPEIEFELLPEIEAPASIEPVAEVPASLPAPVAETVVERTPANVELVSHEEQPASARGEVEIINPDRTMPVVSGDVSALEIPAPIRDFAPVESAPEPVARASSKAPLLVGLGLAAAAAAVIGFFVLKPSGAAPSAPATSSPPAPAASSPAPVAAEPAPEPAPSAPVAATTTPTGSATGLGGDVQPKKPRKSADDAQTAARATSDGLEPPPEEVIPAAPTLGRIGDDAALPSVDAGGVRNDAMDREKALERARREIDSSMRR